MKNCCQVHEQQQARPTHPALCHERRVMSLSTLDHLNQPFLQHRRLVCAVPDEQEHEQAVLCRVHRPPLPQDQPRPVPLRRP